MKTTLYFALAVALPNAAITEAITFDCKMNDMRDLQMSLDREAEELGLIPPSGIPSMIPYLNATDDLLLAFWFTTDGEQLQTLSFNTISGKAALTRVGSKEPLLLEGKCTSRD